MIVFSHGFGVEKDARGLFTEISNALGAESVMFDYNVIDKNGDIHTKSLDQQSKKLAQILGSIDEDIDLICHSQGCLVAGILNPKVRRMIFLAPASTTNSVDFSKKFTGREGTKIDFAGTSCFARSDGSFTFVEPNYWNSLDALGSIDELYSNIAAHTELHLVIASKDEIVNNKISDNLTLLLKSISYIDGAYHDFTAKSRQPLLQKVADIYHHVG